MKNVKAYGTNLYGESKITRIETLLTMHVLKCLHYLYGESKITRIETQHFIIF